MRLGFLTGDDSWGKKKSNKSNGNGRMAAGEDGPKLNRHKAHCCGGAGALCGHSGAGGGHGSPGHDT